ncbi:hypothetical protein ACFOMD_06165 [Sphingoaurantiacus capsulatus]|uniref:Uncharacterized protein n=1 Tax=Sphingoaurantiacus capsulatus TaxID=1771310 RepID=A0ABV7X7L9_9SPHN
MRILMTTLALAAAVTGPEALATSLTMDCGPATPVAAAAPAASPTAAPAAPTEAPNLHGNWDFLMDVGGTPSFGLLSIGQIDGGYGGSLTPIRTAPVVLRRITLTGGNFHMVVASREGDVLYDGILSPEGDRMCGMVTYHNGQSFPMLAQKRASTYVSRPWGQAGR